MRGLRDPATAVAVATAALLLLVSSRYGYHRDELYFIEAGQHLDWGYPDQPPLVPLLARLTSWSDSLVLLRLPSTLSAAGVVLLAGRLARRLGAARSGEWLASLSTALCGFVLGTGHLLSTSTFELLGWAVISWLVVVLLQGGDPRLWLAVGVVGGLAFQVQPLVAFLLVGLALALRRPGPLAAGAVALAMGLPYLIWQGRHDWPQLDVARGIAEGASGSSVPRGLLIPFFLLQVGPWLLPVWLTGLRRLWRDPVLRPLAWVFVGLALVFTALGGKPYYLAGLVPLLLAAGAQPVADRLPRWGVAALVALSTPALLFTLPVLPEKQAGVALAVNPDAGETIGWPSFARQAVAAGGPSSVFVTWNYGQAGALDRFTPNPVHSGHNGYALWGPPPGRREAVMVGVPEAVLERVCRREVRVGTIRSPHGLDNDENGTKLATCAPRAPWAELWPQLVHYG